MTRRSKKSTKGRTRKHPSSVRLLLLTGIPGTGKTTLGDYLREKHRFRHLDFENLATLQRYLGHGIAGLERHVQALRRDGRDVVISWGFLPEVHLPYVLELRRLGFNWIWLNGDRAAAAARFSNAALSRRLCSTRSSSASRLSTWSPSGRSSSTRSMRKDASALRPSSSRPCSNAGRHRAGLSSSLTCTREKAACERHQRADERFGPQRCRRMAGGRHRIEAAHDAVRLVTAPGRLL